MKLKSAGDKIFDAINVVIMLLLLFVFLYPMVDQLWLSLSTAGNATKQGLRVLPRLPLSFEAYFTVFRNSRFIVAIGNSLFRTVLGTLCTLAVTIPAAYALSKKPLPGRKLITLLILFTMFFSGGLIPTYMLVDSVGLINSRLAWILPGLTSAWYILIARNFLQTIPASLEESAMVDGAGTIRVLLQIVLPISKPIIAVIAMWSAISHWNAWFDAMLYTKKNELMVLQLLLRRILIENQRDAMGVELSVPTALTTPETVKAATIIVTVLPIICVYPFFQKYFVKGINVGAVKG